MDVLGNKWTIAYGKILSKAISLYNINASNLAEDINVSDNSSIRQWCIGRNFSHTTYHGRICNKLEKRLSELSRPNLDNLMIQFIKETLKPLGIKSVIDDSKNNDIGKNVAYFLKVCYSEGKNHKREKQVKQLNYKSSERKQKKQDSSANRFPATGETKAVVFDFDGTLTKGNADQNTWEAIWVELGYDLKVDQDLLRRFNSREINYTTWLKLIEEKFKEHNLNKEMILKIAEGIQLIDGCKETFEELQRRNIKIYIVSGSILTVIQNVLKELCQYIVRIEANDFKFSADGLLTEILKTNYDFTGKKRFINEEIATKMKISTKDILFVGNSYNDKHVWRSGAQTLCINHKDTDTSDLRVWHHDIPDCKNLVQILDYVKSPSVQ